MKQDMLRIKEMVDQSVAALAKQEEELSTHKTAIIRSHEQAVEAIEQGRVEAMNSINVVVQSVENLNLNTRIAVLESISGGVGDDELKNFNQRIQNLEQGQAASASGGSVAQRVQALEARLEGARDGGRGGEDEWYGKGYLPVKNQCPKPMKDKVEEWRVWKEECADYFDAQKEGVKEFLSEIEDKADDADPFWLQQQAVARGKPFIAHDRVKIWRALRGLTEGEAKKIILSVKDEDGWLAWRRLCQHFEPGVAGRQGRVLAEFTALTANPAKSIAETRRLITEMATRMKAVEDITGQRIDDLHAKSVLLHMIDPVARQHTAMWHAQRDFQILKQQIIEWTNNASTATGGPTPMQVGSIEPEDQESQGADWSWSQ